MGVSGSSLISLIHHRPDDHLPAQCLAPPGRPKLRSRLGSGRRGPRPGGRFLDTVTVSSCFGPGVCRPH
jgi:hypothetical protein